VKTSALYDLFLILSLFLFLSLSLAGLLRRLPGSSIGGHRLEIRYDRKGLWDALNSFGTLCLDDLDSLNEWLNSFSIFSTASEKQVQLAQISVDQYLQYVKAIFTLACNNPSISGVLGGSLFFGDTRKKLDEEEREMTEMVFNSFGYFSDRYC